jgi:hypothetical protein
VRDPDGHALLSVLSRREGDLKGTEAVTIEEKRLEESRERTAHWKRWGPYLAERAWGTVREDYSADGDAWDYLPHEQARSKAYRWNEDGIAGICDRHQQICFALALWNGRDPILKERLFGLSGKEGNHGEDVKEYYFYLDSTPTHSYMKYLYKYPQSEFPYARLLEENRRRGKLDPEFELLDTGIFEEDRYFDVFVEYAKADPEDILVRIRVANRAPVEATIQLLPTLWFRNTWTWDADTDRPQLRRAASLKSGAGVESSSPAGAAVVEAEHETYGTRYLYCEGEPELLFTENDTNTHRLYGTPNGSFVKDGINDYVVRGAHGAVNPEGRGTKAAARYVLTIPPGGESVVRLRFTNEQAASAVEVFGEFEQTFEARVREADEFYASVTPADLSEDARNVMRQSFAGLLWSKQFYHYVVKQWLDGDPALPPPPPERKKGRNCDWKHLYNSDVISMPDKWEYPWYAAWDLGFHCVALALVDSEFAKEQLILMLREWYMHPNGQLPAYEWNFSDVNPPVHAWAALRVYRIEKKRRDGVGDRAFLERVFHKLLLNFTWWVNRKDAEGNNIFEGGFLGLDNIGVFDRSKPLPGGSTLEQSDGTSWMAMYTLNLLAIAMELAREDPTYEDVASKFWEHFVYIADAMNNVGTDNYSLWDDEDGFYYDVLHAQDGTHFPVRVHSMVGIVPLFAVETLDSDVVDRLPGFKKRMEWFVENRPDLTNNIACIRTLGAGERRLLAIADQDKLRRVLRVMLDESEFLSPCGVRALSRFHLANPFMLKLDGEEHRVDYDPAESTTGLFGGNSNWRGPVWFPANYLIIESLQKFHYYFGDDFRVECPAGSGQMKNLWEVAAELSRRLSRIFLRGEDGTRPVFGGSRKFQEDTHWRDHLLFYEYFHGDTGMGLGASHQTGWTGLVAKLLQQSGE